MLTSCALSYVDWANVYASANLVVDTVNSSAGHAVRERQVLRLGAGWRASTGADGAGRGDGGDGAEDAGEDRLQATSSRSNSSR